MTSSGREKQQHVEEETNERAETDLKWTDRLVNVISELKLTGLKHMEFCGVTTSKSRKL